ncbi:helix-turn-helix transcriptional regulator [Microbispora sp. RL4-1S]|uniref:Helix-turn-helix transcriptional regulator n=2 Tax=Microbispora oryzae TaxID=2806554 RepID=A0A940WM02_9ACTN|nr:helix-turn-helix transcriptional regulator [Microbispora oryzae]
MIAVAVPISATSPHARSPSTAGVLGADMLRDTDATVATVARKVGYEDSFAFSVAFKRARGVSPSVWRRQSADPNALTPV